MMSARTVLVLGLATFVSAGAFAADPAWYRKKATWQETIEASRKAFAERPKEAGPSKPLPDFGRADFSILAWVRTTRGGTILAKAPATGVWAPQGKAFFVRGGRVCYDIGWVGTLQSGARVADGKWHHVAVTKKRHALQIFIDGRADKSGKLAGGPDVPGHVVKIGSTSSNFPRPSGLAGELDDLRVYGRALSPAEISAHAKTLQPAKATGLAACWPFDTGLADASDSGNDATRSGRIATAAGKHGKALKLDGTAHAVVGAAGGGGF